MSKKKKPSKSTPQKKNKTTAKKEDYTTIIIFSVIILIAAIVTGIVWFTKGNNSTTENGGTPSLDADTTYYADIVIQDHGTITVKLDPEAAPITVANFIKLANSGFYSGTTFHRIIEGFMMQGGAPKSQADEPDSIVGEFSANNIDNPLKHERGVISMARTNDMNSASSQFFIMHQTGSHLDGKYAAFGKVTEGMDIVDAICEAAKPTDNNGSIAKDAQPVITSITIRTEK